MTPGGQVIEWLTADANFTKLAGRRLYPGVLPQGSVLPAVVYNVIDDLPLNTLQGSGGLRNVHLQLDVYDKSYLKAQEVGKAANAVLGSLAVDGQSSLRVNGRDLYEDDTELYRVSQDYSLWLKEE